MAEKLSWRIEWPVSWLLEKVPRWQWYLLQAAARLPGSSWIWGHGRTPLGGQGQRGPRGADGGAPRFPLVAMVLQSLVPLVSTPAVKNSPFGDFCRHLQGCAEYGSILLIQGYMRTSLDCHQSCAIRYVGERGRRAKCVFSRLPPSHLPSFCLFYFPSTVKHAMDPDETDCRFRPLWANPQCLYSCALVKFSSNR